VIFPEIQLSEPLGYLALLCPLSYYLPVEACGRGTGINSIFTVRSFCLAELQEFEPTPMVGENPPYSYHRRTFPSQPSRLESSSWLEDRVSEWA
jgi:hypothetical protein